MIDPAEVKAAINAADLIGQTVRLKRGGNGVHIGICPEHREKSPSFWVYPGDRGFHCFGCGWNGSVIDWVMWRDSVDFKTALRELAATAGLTDERPAERPILQPKDPKFPNDGPALTHWGGQKLLSTDNRPVFIFNDFPGRRKYLAIAERMPSLDFIWWPAQHSTAKDMWLAPIAARLVRLDVGAGIWECHRALALLDRIYGARRGLQHVDPRAEADLLFEVPAHVETLGQLLDAKAARPVPSRNETTDAAAA